MACRLPGADSVIELWPILEHGTSSHPLIDRVYRFTPSGHTEPRRGNSEEEVQSR